METVTHNKKAITILQILSAHPEGLWQVEIEAHSDGKLRGALVSILLDELQRAALIWSMHVSSRRGGWPRPQYRLTNKGKQELAQKLSA